LFGFGGVSTLGVFAGVRVLVVGLVVGLNGV